MFRLARFNVMEEEYIVGLPITIAGMVMGLKHLLDISHRFSFVNRAIINIENIIIMISLSLLMVSSFKIKKPKIL